MYFVVVLSRSDDAQIEYAHAFVFSERRAGFQLASRAKLELQMSLFQGIRKKDLQNSNSNKYYYLKTRRKQLLEYFQTESGDHLICMRCNDQLLYWNVATNETQSYWAAQSSENATVKSIGITSYEAKRYLKLPEKDTVITLASVEDQPNIEIYVHKIGHIRSIHVGQRIKMESNFRIAPLPAFVKQRKLNNLKRALSVYSKGKTLSPWTLSVSNGEWSKALYFEDV